MRGKRFVLALAVLAPVCTWLPALIDGDINGRVLTLLISPFTLLLLLLVARRNKQMSGPISASIFCVIWLMLAHSADTIHRNARWALQSSSLKAEVLAEAQVPGDLQHTFWEDHGTLTDLHLLYVVYNPSDDLRRFTNDKHNPLRPVTAHCEIESWQRLELHWYLVTLYRNARWEPCLTSSDLD